MKATLTDDLITKCVYLVPFSVCQSASCLKYVELIGVPIPNATKWLQVPQQNFCKSIVKTETT